MFYPVDSLRRGGKFYMCWVADSWPSRFAAISHRQLWSQDIRKLCDDLAEVVSNESGRPINRFSLRLSSQLLRGLVRLYERKVTVVLGEICMINAHVFKATNKKWILQVERVPAPRQLPQLPPPTLEHPDNEPRVEEMIQNSGNVVSNIQDITLKEAVIPEFQLPPNDGFGEEHPEQAFHLAVDRTIEQIMVTTDVSGAQHSGLDMPLDVTTDKSHDKSRLALHATPQMERISEHDVSLFRKSIGVEIQQAGDFEKDIPEIPETLPLQLPVPEPEPEKQAAGQPPRISIPESEIEIPVPEQGKGVLVAEPEKEIPVPEPEKELPVLEPEKELPVPEPEKVVQEQEAVTSKEKEPEEIELEELEEGQQPAKRARTKKKLIIDKNIKLSSNFFRARLDNPNVELRCEDSEDDVIEVRHVPWIMLSTRPAHAGVRRTYNMTPLFHNLFQRNCGIVTAIPLAERQTMEVVAEPRRTRQTRSALASIFEEREEMLQEKQQVSVEPPVPVVEAGITMAQIEPPADVNISRVAVERVEEMLQEEQQVTVEPPVPIVEVDITMAQIEPPADVNISRGQADIPTIEVTVPAEPDVTLPREQRVGLTEPEDFYNLLTQKLETISQQGKKRPSDYDKSPKRQRPSGYISFSESLSQRQQKHILEVDQYGADKENLPPETNQQFQARDVIREVSTMLQEAGLSEIHPNKPESLHLNKPEPPPVEAQTQPRQRKEDSGSDETPLGSLDRTKVSLGDSVHTTDSQRFIRDHWGIEGTMVKIIKNIKVDARPITVESLVAKGPVIYEYRAIIAARCFTSILKLKQHQFIKVIKDPESLAVRDIVLGPRLADLQRF